MARVVTLIFGLLILASGGFVGLGAVALFFIARHPSWSGDMELGSIVAMLLICGVPFAIGAFIARIGWTVIRGQLGSPQHHLRP